jgi:hypothetical protein
VPGQPFALKVWYGDGTTRQTRVSPGDYAALRAAWEAWPGTGVQYVQLFYDATYQIWKQDGYDEQGRPVNQRQETEHYVDGWHSLEFYYYDTRANAPAPRFGAANLSRDVPNQAVTKRAAAMADDAWRTLYERAKEERRAP